VTRNLLLPLVAVALLASACGAPKPGPEEGLSAGAAMEVAEEAGSLPDTTGGAAEPVIIIPERDPYRLAVGDVIRLEFFYYPRYSMNLVVRPDGYLTVPLLGEVRAEGMRPSELEELVRSKYGEVLTEPEVSVVVLEFGDNRIFIFGEVNEPGAYDLHGSTTVLDAVAEAGGITYQGRTDSIILIRQQPDGTFAGTRVNLQDLLAGRASDNVRLGTGDVVYVPMTFIAKVDVFVDQFFAKLTPTWYFFISGREVVNPEGRYIIGR